MTAWEKHAERLRRQEQLRSFDNWILAHPWQSRFFALGGAILVGEVAMLLKYALIRLLPVVLLAAVFLPGAHAQTIPDAPVPQLTLKQDAPGRFHYETVSAVRSPRPRFDTGWWTRATAIAVAADYSTTGLLVARCIDRHVTWNYPVSWCNEGNPLARPLIGARPPAWRLALAYPIEVGAIAAIPNKKLRRVVQVAAIGAHTFFAVRNYHRYRTWLGEPR